MAQVIDFSAGRPSAATVKAAGYIGSVRYLSWMPNGKVVTLAECQDFWAHDLSIGLVWEVAASPLGSDANAAGQEAARQAKALGFPANWPLYVAFDYDAPQQEWAALAGWGDQFSRASGHPWRGYCKGLLGDQLVADGHFASYWEPYAWSGGYVSPHACLFQRLQTVTLDGIDCDVNDILQADWAGYKPNTNPPNQVLPMYNPPIQITSPVVAALNCPQGGTWMLTQDGAVYGWNAPYHGGANGQSYFAGRKAAQLVVPDAQEAAAGKFYTIIDSTGARYSY